ncbi:hypothetical protein MMC07_009655 [Pseudocyphellaria aurata]|nr:hypothetical protein [Pseudocyphellaria aurata]
MCRWPVIAGIAIGGLLFIPIIWCFARLVCCRTIRRRGPKDPPSYKRSSIFHPPPSQGYKPAPQPPPYESPKNADLELSSQGKVSPEAPGPLPGKAIDDHRDEDVELGRLDPAHMPNASMLAHQEPPPMARLSPINTQNPHDPPHRPHDSMQNPFGARHMSHNSLPGAYESLHRRQDSSQHRHDSLRAQSPFSDLSATDSPLGHRPPFVHRPYSPFVPQRSYSPYSPQQPYSPYLPYSPVSPYTTTTTKYESPMFAEHYQPYRAYSPAVSTHYEPSVWNEPVELPSPYNKRPDSLIFAQGLQSQSVENKSVFDTMPFQPQKEPAHRASPMQPETTDTLVQEQQHESKHLSPRISPEPPREADRVTGGAPPPVRTPTPGRAL